MKLFESYKVKSMELKNRMVMPPMCMYVAKDGMVNDFHTTHYSQRAIGQVGLIIVESTGVLPNGRITDNCLGLWDDKQIDGMKRIVDSVHYNGSKIAIQLNHAGRKSETTGLKHIGASKLEYNDLPLDYEEATKEEIDEIIKAFRDAAKRADEAGFDGLEIHSAHGYLIHQFLSPISNKRNDEYGKDKFLFLKNIIKSIREVWPEDKPLWIRISSTDYLEGGLEVEDWIKFLNENPNIVDLVHVSAGGLVIAPIKVYPGYMLQYAKRIKEETSYKTIGVGTLNEADLINYALESEVCDLVASGRELLRNPHFFLNILHSRRKKELIPSAYRDAYR